MRSFIIFPPLVIQVIHILHVKSNSDETVIPSTVNATENEDLLILGPDPETSTDAMETTTQQSVHSHVQRELKEISYYLRYYKFNEYDRRYEKKPENDLLGYYRRYPNPPLRSLHWEVRKFCETSLTSCMEYLHKKIKQTGFRREDDTNVVIEENHWTITNNSEQIRQIDEECKNYKRIDDIQALPFEGPIERFQWRTTASYYLCHYTMSSPPELAHLNDRCDNYANCLDEKLGSRNGDPRADDSVPFACSLYSFCPDFCCGQRHVQDKQSCWENKADNPCYEENPRGQRSCGIDRLKNTELRDIILNRWNVTCSCFGRKGFRWDSLYGICVDIDECTEAEFLHTCDIQTEACVNLEGGFRCACNWGFVWNVSSQRCSKSHILDMILLHKVHKEDKQDKEQESYFRRLMDLFKGSDGAQSSAHLMLLFISFALVGVF